MLNNWYGLNYDLENSTVCPVFCVQRYQSLSFNLLVNLPSERTLSLIFIWVCEAVRIYCREAYSKASVWKKETSEIDFISHELTT